MNRTVTLSVTIAVEHNSITAETLARMVREAITEEIDNATIDVGHGVTLRDVEVQS